MNYRLSLQRVYAVLAVTWIAALLAMIPSYRLKFWSVEIPKSVLTFQGYDPVRNALYLLRFYILFHILPNPSWNSRLQKFAWLAGILVLLPALGYALLFLVIPWVFRGFRPAPH